MARAARAALARVPDLPEWIDAALIAREGWPAWRAALGAAHAPAGPADLSPDAAPRRRLAYDELFAHQVTLALARARRRRAKGFVTAGDGRLRRAVLDALPFVPTGAQTRAIAEIAADMAKAAADEPAAAGRCGRGQDAGGADGALDRGRGGRAGRDDGTHRDPGAPAPEEPPPLGDTPGVVAGLTGRDKGAERQAVLDALAAGDIQILVGTHAVFQPDVAFRRSAPGGVDEQHRFGVAQRMELGAKGRHPTCW
jgi:ATP-dependent DNA helicase RecG